MIKETTFWKEVNLQIWKVYRGVVVVYTKTFKKLPLFPGRFNTCCFYLDSMLLWYNLNYSTQKNLKTIPLLENLSLLRLIFLFNTCDPHILLSEYRIWCIYNNTIWKVFYDISIPTKKWCLLRRDWISSD